MNGLRMLMVIGTLSLAVLVLMIAGPVCAAEYPGGGTGGPSTMAPPPGAPGGPAPAGTPSASAPAAKPAYFSGGGGTFTAHERPMEESEAETMEAYRIKTWRANYVRAMKKQRAEKAALKKIRRQRLYPVSALASIQAD